MPDALNHPEIKKTRVPGTECLIPIYGAAAVPQVTGAKPRTCNGNLKKFWQR
jgi:hypothetical protein